MGVHPLSLKIDDDDYVSLARARAIVKRLFGLGELPSNSQVLSWLLRSVPWDEVVGAADKAEHDRYEQRIAEIQAM
jgi:hypothetical protein